MSIVDPRKRVDDYLEQHNLRAVIQGCLAQALYHKPTNPKKFLVQHLEAIKASGNRPQLLNKKDITAMFSMFDITNKGWVTVTQAENALGTILGKSRSPDSEEGGFIDWDQQLNLSLFVKYMCDRLGIVE